MSSISLQRRSSSYASALDEDVHQENLALRAKLANQPAIEQAKGMLMGAFGLSAEHAFELLKSVSQTQNVKLRTVAQHVAERWASGGPRPDYDEAAEFLVTVWRHFGRD